MKNPLLLLPFQIYERYVGKFFPETSPQRMLEILCSCREYPLRNADVSETHDINRHSARKLMEKLCKAGLAEHRWLSPGFTFLTADGCQVLEKLESAMGISS